MRPLQKLAGRTFGRWTVIEQDLSRGSVRGGLWKCRCDCGNEKSVRTRMLIEGWSKSCGCFHRDQVSVPNTWQKIHGEGSNDARTPEYRAWAAMKNRCYNKKDKRYPEWGGRGITVCDEWLEPNGYLNFLIAVGRRPSRRHSLGRIHNGAHYTPGNVRWETAVEQAQNRQSTIFMIRIDGVIDSMSQHCIRNKWEIERFRYHLLKGRKPQQIANYIRFKKAGYKRSFQYWLVTHML